MEIQPDQMQVGETPGVSEVHVLIETALTAPPHFLRRL